MDKARINRLYAKLEKLGVFEEVNVLLWHFTTGAAKNAYAEGVETGKEDGTKTGYEDGFNAGFEAGYAKAME